MVEASNVQFCTFTKKQHYPMKKCALLSLFLTLFCSVIFAKEKEKPQKADNDAAEALITYMKFRDSVDNAMQYESGLVKLENGKAILNLPSGFKFLNAAQSKFIVHDVWNNPGGEDVLGMIFPNNGGPFADSSYAFVVTYDAIGFVKDDDADDMDYEKMFKEEKEAEPAENAERVKKGYEPAFWIGWAQAPFYDSKNKVLHWAKELDFTNGDSTAAHTLNYDVRFLGRDGVLSLNAVAGIDELPLVKADIDKVLGMATFTAGNAYADFDSKTDQVAAYTVGGLVAGKVLAKVGFFALLLKFWKLIVIGLIAAGAGIKKFFFGKKEDTSVETYANEEPAALPNAEDSQENDGHQAN
jgi:uncharacterized membrane-anchored protein